MKIWCTCGLLSTLIPLYGMEFSTIDQKKLETQIATATKACFKTKQLTSQEQEHVHVALAHLYTTSTPEIIRDLQSGTLKPQHEGQLRDLVLSQIEGDIDALLRDGTLMHDRKKWNAAYDAVHFKKEEQEQRAPSIFNIIVLATILIYMGNAFWGS